MNLIINERKNSVIGVAILKIRVRMITDPIP
jgi:hypothetical protein